MSSIDYYSKYRKYKYKYLYLQSGGKDLDWGIILNYLTGGDFQKIIGEIINKDKSNKIKNLLKAVIPLANDPKKINEELIKQIDTVKELIEKLLSKLPLPLSVGIAFKAGLKILFISGKANINIIITPIKPIIIKISELLRKVDLDKLK
jgi:hypothetical protein